VDLPADLTKAGPSQMHLRQAPLQELDAVAILHLGILAPMTSRRVVDPKALRKKGKTENHPVYANL
jgi:hypothetical protein